MKLHRLVRRRLWVVGALALFLATLAISSSGCRTRSGSREFIPGKGWVPN